MPAGSGPFGLGTPATSEPPPTGPAGSRYLNPATRDFEVDQVTGQFAQMPPVRQRVLLALITIRGSSSVLPSFGVHVPPKMNELFEAQVRNSVASALRQLTDVEQVIRVDRIDVERGTGGRALITVSYTNLQSGEEEEPVTV
jgi:phage baseplate assembly protein W